jgi:hypothetical protein
MGKSQLKNVLVFVEHLRNVITAHVVGRGVKGETNGYIGACQLTGYPNEPPQRDHHEVRRTLNRFNDKCGKRLNTVIRN